MAKILVVDDRPINREFLVTLLGYQKHRLLEASDGADALALARAEHPDLVISDILMPTMDGYEFVRQLRLDPAVAGIPVIFYTAHYHKREAEYLAKSCGVAHILIKPCESELILRAVEESLNTPMQIASRWPPQDFNHDHLRIITDKLSQTADELTIANQRLGALLDICLQLASQRDPRQLLQHVCRAARDLLGAKYAVLAIKNKDTSGDGYFVTSGMDVGIAHSLGRPEMREGIVGSAFNERKSRRLINRDGNPQAVGLPSGHPPVHSLLVAPVVSLAHVYGWICLTDKIGADEFSAEDEQMVSTLAAQVGRIYENGSLYLELQKRIEQLDGEIAERQKAQQAMAESERRFSDMLRSIELVSLMLDRDARITYCNDYFLRLTGWQRGEVVGRNWFELFIPPEHEELKKVFLALLNELPEASHYENEILTRSGTRRLIRWNNSILRSATGDVIGTASIGEDITEQKLAEDKIRRLNRVYAVLSGINTLIVRVRDRQELFGEACRIAVEHGKFGMAWIGLLDTKTQDVTPAAWAGECAEEITKLKSSAREDTPRGKGAVGEAIRQRQPVFNNDIGAHNFGGPRLEVILRVGFRSQITLPLYEGQTIVGTLTMYAREPNFFDADELRLLVELAGDISFVLEHIAKGEQLQYLAYYDDLTGLPNRTLFLDRMKQHLHARGSEPRIVAMILLDLERFRMINETLGREGGDQLLRLVARRLEYACQGNEHLARIGPNSYGVVIRGARNAADVAHAIENQVLACFRKAYSVKGTELRLAAKAGVALYPDDGSDADTLFRNAEAALQKARGSDDRYLFYATEMNARAAQALSLETRLRNAVDARQFVLHYQPKFELASRRLCGLEALIRWQEPETGLVPPGHFIPLLEETGLIIEVGQWVLAQALADYRDWVQRGYEAPRIAVNVSAVQMRQRNFMDTVIDAVQAAGDIPEALELEITESLMMSDIKENIRVLSVLRGMGISISMDDFGTGYSSLSYIARLPIDKVKIDRSFVNGMMGNAQDMLVATTIITLTHSLGFRVIAEGVETEEQARALEKLQCDEVQGYLFSKPLAKAQIEPLLTKVNPRSR